MSPTLRLLGLLLPLRGWLAVAILMSIGALLSGIALTAIASYLIAKAAVVDDVAALAVAFAAVRGFAVARAGFRYLERLISHSLTLRVLVHLRTWFFAAIEPLAPAALTRHRSGDLLARAVSDVQTLENFYIRVVVPPVAALLTIAFVGVLFGMFYWLLAALVAAALLVEGLVLPLVAQRLGRRASEELVQARAELEAAMVDEVRGIADLLTFDRLDWHVRNMELMDQKVEAAQQRLATLRGSCNGFTALLTALVALVVLALAIPLVRAGELDGVYLAMLVLVAIASFEAVHGLPTALQQQQESSAAARRIFELVDAPTPGHGPEGLSTVPTDFSLELLGVCFRYSSEAPLAIQDLSFDVPEGQKLAIVGGSGCGKTTIVNLLLRFWDCTSGEILLGRRDLGQYDPDEVRSYFGVVPQDVHLFNGTIRDNLQVANADATQSQMDEACRLAVLDRFIGDLPNGYDTFVGEDGLLLSGGERQRIAIARMLLKDAPVVILDEPSANLDEETERELVDRLRPALAAKTALIFTHRPLVCELADEVVDMERGRISGRTSATR